MIDDIYKKLGGSLTRYQGITYNLTEGNSYSLLSTPNLWGIDPGSKSYWQIPGKTPADNLLSAIENLIASAEYVVDISTLMPLPDGKFLTAIRNGLRKLVDQKRYVVVRVLAGIETRLMIRDIEVDLEQWLRNLDIENLPVYAAAMQSFPASSWNHSKIIAVDGKRAIVGGHNLWSNDYCSFAPVHDVSIEVTGPAACDAHHFLNRLWEFTCDYSRTSSPLQIWTKLWLNGEILPNGMPQVQPPESGGTGTTRILSLGQLGGGIDKYLTTPDPSREARIQAVASAKQTIRLSQQDLGFSQVVTSLFAFDERLMQALGDAVARGVTLYLVMSDAEASNCNGDSYSFGQGLLNTAKKIRDAVSSADKTIRTTEDSIKLLQERVHIAPMRFCDKPQPVVPGATPWKWAGWWKGKNRKIEPANHAKVYIIDDNAFYVGSDNAYPAGPQGLQEFGYLIEGESETRVFLEQYWNLLWRYASQWEFTDWAETLPQPTPVVQA